MPKRSGNLRARLARLEQHGVGRWTDLVRRYEAATNLAWRRRLWESFILPTRAAVEASNATGDRVTDALAVDHCMRAIKVEGAR